MKKQENIEEDTLLFFSKSFLGFAFHFGALFIKREKL
jgi:hypothetical protein